MKAERSLEVGFKAAVDVERGQDFSRLGSAFVVVEPVTVVSRRAGLTNECENIVTVNTCTSRTMRRISALANREGPPYA
jgi:hypothetical protein